MFSDVWPPDQSKRSRVGLLCRYVQRESEREERAVARKPGYLNCYAEFQKPSRLRTGEARSACSLTTSPGTTDHAEPADGTHAGSDGLKQIKAGLDIRRRCVLKSRGSAQLRPSLSPWSAASLRYLAPASISAFRLERWSHLGGSDVLFRLR